MTKKVKLTLVGIDGNAFSLMGAFKGAARKQGWTQDEIKVVLDKCMSSDYNQLLCTLMDNTVSEDEDEEGNEAGDTPKVGDRCCADTEGEGENEYGVITKIEDGMAYSNLAVFGASNWEFSGDTPTRKEDGVWVFDSF
jgi:hypothetical protein